MTKTQFLSLSLYAWLPALLLGGCADDDSSTSNGADATGTSTTAGEAETPESSSDSGSDSDDADASSSRGDDSTGSAGLEITGTWDEAFAPDQRITHVISEQRWDQTAPFGDSGFQVETYDNAGRWAIAVADDTNEFSPGLYNKFNWTWDGDALYYCTAVFDAASAEDAIGAPDGDADDLEGGCAGFAWSSLTPG